uniref:Uncharacterized protein n=1 Tax=Magnetococcus massalia (strain MO-1) TaxID=451514 RepID=A0A1S7LIH3_MAGMO|nr:protein of unknown function [Candidatus Magnetococcus massalia]
MFVVQLFVRPTLRIAGLWDFLGTLLDRPVNLCWLMGVSSGLSPIHSVRGCRYEMRILGS